MNSLVKGQHYRQGFGGREGDYHFCKAGGNFLFMLAFLLVFFNEILLFVVVVDW